MSTLTTMTALGLLLFGLAGTPAAHAQSSQQQQAPQQQQPQRQTNNVNALVEDFVLVELAEKAWVGGDFTVKADGGRVTLDGTVPTEAAKARMERIARGTLGVTDVRNQLRVEPLTSSGTPVGDDVLARRVARQVAAALPGAKTGEDWWLTGWRVEGPDNTWNFVIEVEDGRVYLEGDVPRRAIMRKAIDAARNTSGVQSVRSELELDRYAGAYPYGYPYAYPYGPYPAYGYHPWGGDPDYYVYDIDVGPGQNSDSGGPTDGHRLTGRVSDLDRQKGRISLKTDAGTVQISAPPSALREVQRGDRVTVQIGEPGAQPAASPAGDAGDEESSGRGRTQ
jgi:osmotically-inducible protein OsmY